MKRICLVYPKTMQLPDYFNFASNISSTDDNMLPPLGMLYLLSNSRYEIEFIDNRIHRLDAEALYTKLCRYDIVGFGGTIFEIKEARTLSYRLLRDGIFTIYGGPNATTNWNLYLNYFSMIVRGEGEQIFDRIIDNIENKNNFSELGFTQIDNTYVNLDLYRVTNHDKLSFPDREAININDYKRDEHSYLPGCYPVDTVVSSRGCPFDCYFCSSKFIWERKYAARSIDNIVKEIVFLKKHYDTKAVYFREDNFTVNRSRVNEFCEKIRNHDLLWICESRVDTLDEELIKKMANSGCKGIWFGIESTDNAVLKRIGKGITIEQAEETIELCNHFGIRTGGGFMLGFPFDTEKSIMKNYTESKRLNLSVHFYNRVWAVPISQMYFEILHRNLDYYSFENIILPSTESLSADEVNKLYYRLVSRKIFIDNKLQKIIPKRLSNSIKEKLPYLVRFYRKLLSG